MKRGSVNFPPQTLKSLHGTAVAVDRVKTTKTCPVVSQAKITELSQQMSANKYAR